MYEYRVGIGDFTSWNTNINLTSQRSVEYQTLRRNDPSQARRSAVRPSSDCSLLSLAWLESGLDSEANRTAMLHSRGPGVSKIVWYNISSLSVNFESTHFQEEFYYQSIITEQQTMVWGHEWKQYSILREYWLRTDRFEYCDTNVWSHRIISYRIVHARLINNSICLFYK